jgi:fatty-acyl-CoA synthase
MLRNLFNKKQQFQLRKNHFKAEHLSKTGANYAPLTPLSTFKRATSLYPSKNAYVYENVTRTWGEISKRVSRFSSALAQVGVKKGDVVSVMAPNIPALMEAHFAVPGIGAVLHSINTRLDATTVAYQLHHSEAKVVFVDNAFGGLLEDAKSILVNHHKVSELPIFIGIKDDHFHVSEETPAVGNLDYEEFLKTGDEGFALLPCSDEWDAISLNYTSGTTGNPKGVVCHHRGAYLNAASNIVEWNMERFSKMLLSKNAWQ